MQQESSNRMSHQVDATRVVISIHSKHLDFSFVWLRFPWRTLPMAPQDKTQSAKPTLAFKTGDFGLSKNDFCQCCSFRCYSLRSFHACFYLVTLTIASIARLALSVVVWELGCLDTPQGFIACFDATRFDRSNVVLLLFCPSSLGCLGAWSLL